MADSTELSVLRIFGRAKTTNPSLLREANFARAMTLAHHTTVKERLLLLTLFFASSEHTGDILKNV